MIEHVIIYNDDMMQSYHMPFQHPQGQESEWLYDLHWVLDEGLFILNRKEWPVFVSFWILRYSQENSRNWLGRSSIASVQFHHFLISQICIAAMRTLAI
jgi:hypothetical protein